MTQEELTSKLSEINNNILMLKNAIKDLENKDKQVRAQYLLEYPILKEGTKVRILTQYQNYDDTITEKEYVAYIGEHLHKDEPYLIPYLYSRIYDDRNIGVKLYKTKKNGEKSAHPLYIAGEKIVKIDIL